MAGALASRYARALTDVVTARGAEISPEKATGELRDFISAFQANSGLRNVLLSPAVAPAKKKAIIGEIGRELNLGQVTRNFLFVLTDHRRLALLGEMLPALEAALDERLGVRRVDIISSQPVDPAQQSELEQRLRRITGGQVRLQFSLDPGLLGGAVARVGSTIYDGSVRGRLEALARRLAANA